MTVSNAPSTNNRLSAFKNVTTHERVSPVLKSFTYSNILYAFDSIVVKFDM